MSAPLTPSQTVGPFYGIGLPFERGEQIVESGSPASIRIEGQILDGNGEAVVDALLEIWQPDAQGRYRTASEGNAGGFGRCRTDSEGVFSFVTVKPGPARAPDGAIQAPHLNMTVFARGLLRHLVTRLYFPDEVAANETDPVLNRVDPARRATLIARDAGGLLRFDIRLQGEGETVFFAI